MVPASNSGGEHPAEPRETTGGGTPTRGGRLARHRRLVLLAFSLLLTVLALGAIEGACRIAGYGGYGSTFRKAGTLPNGSTLVFTDHAGPQSYFFANRSNPGSLDPTAFEMPKPKGTFRVFLVGESAAKGNPYTRPLTSASFLRAMLQDLWPDRKVEVINLGVTAIASFAVLGIATEALDYEPDLIVAYLGNNEFYGAYGVASLHSAGRSPGMIRLIRATRASASPSSSITWWPANTSNGSKTLMEALVGQSSIGPDDPLRTAAARNLETFVGDLIDRCAARGVPVVVCTPPSNVRDLAPLGRPDLSQLAPAERERVDAALASAHAALASDPAQALAAIDEVLHLAPIHATAEYLRAQALLAQGKDADAAKAYRRAVDLDPMPWRPPSSSIEAIRRAATDHGAILCDMDATFAMQSRGGAAGWELLADHVHPSLEGQDLVARSIVGALAKGPPPVAVDASRAAQLPAGEVYAARLGANPYELFAASHAMRLLAMIPFFQESNPGFLAHHQAACDELAASMPPFGRGAVERWLEVTTHAAEERPVSGFAAEAHLANGRFVEAEALFRFASQAVVPYTNWELEYFYKALMAKVRSGRQLDAADRQAALDAIGRARFIIEAEHGSDSGGPELWAGLLHQIRGELAPSVEFLASARTKLSYPTRLAADEALIRAHLAAGRRDLAEAIVQEGLQGPQADSYRAFLRR